MSLAHEERDADHFKFQGDVTQSAAYIHGSDLWKKVTIRLGTDITRYLLESCSVFVAVPPSCVFQVCGVPAYDRVSMTTASTGFSLLPCSRTQGRAEFGRHQGSVSMKRTHRVENRIIRKKRNRMDAIVKRGKRKREPDQKDEEEVMTCSGKKRRVEEQDPIMDIQQVCNDTVEEEQHSSVKPALSIKPVENGSMGSKQPVERCGVMPPLEGGPSWRSGVFPPLPQSQCFIRTLGFLYGGRGMRGFLLNRKKKSADGSRRLQGRDLVRLVFFEGLAYLNGLERKPKKLPRRFFNMVPLFSRLLKQHRRCPYTRILQKMCPIVEERNAAQGELSCLLPQHCAPHRVYLFVRECLLAVIPQELWGSDCNRLNFLVRVRGFLHSGKFERLSLAELMWKMKVNDCGWLKISDTGKIVISGIILFLFFCYFCLANVTKPFSSAGRFPPSELSYRTQILGQFLAWLLDGYVVSLVRACFYVTESVGQKNALRFYRQEVWAKLQELAFRYIQRNTPAEAHTQLEDTSEQTIVFI